MRAALAVLALGLQVVPPDALTTEHFAEYAARRSDYYLRRARKIARGKLTDELRDQVHLLAHAAAELSPENATVAAEVAALIEPARPAEPARSCAAPDAQTRDLFSSPIGKTSLRELGVADAGEKLQELARIAEAQFFKEWARARSGARSCSRT